MERRTFLGLMGAAAVATPASAARGISGNSVEGLGGFLHMGTPEFHIWKAKSRVTDPRDPEQIFASEPYEYAIYPGSNEPKLICKFCFVPCAEGHEVCEEHEGLCRYAEFRIHTNINQDRKALVKILVDLVEPWDLDERRRLGLRIPPQRRHCRYWKTASGEDCRYWRTARGTDK